MPRPRPRSCSWFGNHGHAAAHGRRHEMIMSTITLRPREAHEWPHNKSRPHARTCETAWHRPCKVAAVSCSRTARNVHSLPRVHEFPGRHRRRLVPGGTGGLVPCEVARHDAARARRRWQRVSTRFRTANVATTHAHSGRKQVAGMTAVQAGLRKQQETPLDLKSAAHAVPHARHRRHP